MIFFKLFRRLETKIHPLNYLFWECTTRCCLNCRHCGSDCISTSAYKDMPLEDFLKAFDSIPKREIDKDFIVVITGGEPLLRPDIEDIGNAIKSRGVKWGMVSNGYLYTPEIHSKLISSGMRFLTVSLDGLELNHNWMRGAQDSFKRVVNTIEFVSKDPRISFDVVTCVNKKNISELEQIYTFLDQRNVRRWRIFTISPIGRAKDEPNMHLSNSEFISLMQFIKNKRELINKERKKKLKMMDITYSCEGYVGSYEEKVRESPFFCRAGINIASVLIDGSICACPNIDRKRFSQGNIYVDNFYDVWRERYIEYRDRKWTKESECKGCKMWKKCLGSGLHNWQPEGFLCHYKKTIRE